MKKGILLIAVLLAGVSASGPAQRAWAAAQCRQAPQGLITQDCELLEENFQHPLRIGKDGITIDCKGRGLIFPPFGQFFEGIGIDVGSHKDVTIRGCEVRFWDKGISIRSGRNLQIIDTDFRHNTTGIELRDTVGGVVRGTSAGASLIHGNDLGIEVYRSRNVVIDALEFESNNIGVRYHQGSDAGGVFNTSFADNQRAGFVYSWPSSNAPLRHITEV
jgi:hypothetical protein